jgi:hypothetical protein
MPGKNEEVLTIYDPVGVDSETLFFNIKDCRPSLNAKIKGMYDRG